MRGWAPGVFLVGFKLLYDVSDDVLVETARAACATNDADLTVANDLRVKQRGEHAVHVVDRDGLIETIGPGGPTRGSARRIESSAEFRARQRAGSRLMSEPRRDEGRVYFPALDGLRFVAFGLVFLFHRGVPQVAGGDQLRSLAWPDIAR